MSMVILYLFIVYFMSMMILYVFIVYVFPPILYVQSNLWLQIKLILSYLKLTLQCD